MTATRWPKIIKDLTIGEGSDLAVDGSTGADNEEDTGAAFTAGRYRVQHLQYRPQTGGARIRGPDARLAAGEEGAGLFRQRRQQDGRGQRSPIARHHQRRHPQQRGFLSRSMRAAWWPPRPSGDATKALAGRQRHVLAAVRRARSRAASRAQQETLYTLAADTGGKALLDNNDLALGIVQAQKDISSYYILGYYSTNDKLDGRYRRIKLTARAELQAKIGKLDYRQGYFAGKEFSKFNSSDKERQLQEALMLGDPMTDLSRRDGSELLPHGARPLLRAGHGEDPGQRVRTARKHGGAESTQARLHRRSAATPRASCRATSATISESS